MKAKLLPLMAVAVLLLSGGWASYPQKEVSKWDYRVIHTFNGVDIQSQLNDLGTAGWQLVSVTELTTGNPQQSFVTLYLKRAR
jgi:hypothetical protein